MDSKQVWAVLIGITNYPDCTASGAQNDVIRHYKYLVDELGVPPENIQGLLGVQATRSAIVSTFQKHLIENEKIKKGAALIFHFSGHGTRCTAPDDWPVVDEDTDEGSEHLHLLEVILPYDYTGPNPDVQIEGPPVPGIPDRTLAALLDMASRKHGANTTVLLDCCHSGHANRSGGSAETESGELDVSDSPFQVRSVPPDTVIPPWKGLDEEIWSKVEETSERAGRPSSGFGSLHGKSHVLLAACDKNEEALGWNQNPATDAGLLTEYWLKALRNKTILPRTYTQLMKSVTEDVARLRKKYPDFVRQNPQCVGITRDRLVFQETALDHQYFLITGKDSDEVEVEEGYCVIWAGKAQGVKEGTIFEICEVDPDTMKTIRTLGKAIATGNIESTWCRTKVEEGVTLSGSCHAGRVVGHPLKYALSKQDDSPETLGILDQLTKKLKELKPEIAEHIQEVQDENEADLVFVVSSDDSQAPVTLKRQDSILKTHDASHHPPTMDKEEVEGVDFSKFLDAIARFNFYISLEQNSSSPPPFADIVDVELHLLEDDVDLDFLGVGIMEKARAKKQKIEPSGEENDIFELTQRDEDDYAFVLQNRGEIPLYVYIVYFDPGTYEISTWYTPTNPEEATLLPGKPLQVGASPEHEDPFTFFVRQGVDVDTSFIKIFLLNQPGKMTFMEQKPQIGCDEEGEKYFRNSVRDGDDPEDEEAEDSKSDEAVKGNWDCVMRMIKVKRSGHGSVSA